MKNKLTKVICVLLSLVMLFGLSSITTSAAAEESAVSSTIPDGPNANGCFYLNGEKQHAYKLIAFDGAYYFVAENHMYVKDSLRYLNETAIFPNCFCDFIPSCRVDHGSSRLPSAYTQEEVRIVEKSVDRTSNIGTRNYAMLLLATRLGLRASDIARIEFSNIDWDKNLVRINQYKTKRLVELPLIKDVGEAIIEYLQTIFTHIYANTSPHPINPS